MLQLAKIYIFLNCLLKVKTTTILVKKKKTKTPKKKKGN